MQHSIQVPDWLWKQAQEVYGVKNPAPQLCKFLEEVLREKMKGAEPTATEENSLEAF